MSIPHDDWAGKASASERRKIQNRLNSRAYRARKGAKTRSKASPNVVVMRSSSDSEEEPSWHTHQGTLMTNELRDKFLTFADPTFLARLRQAPSPGHLPIVIHLNLLNGLAGNAAALGMGMPRLWLICDSVSPFSTHRPHHAGVHLDNRSSLPLPPNMQPTALQRTAPHHPWIDLLPLPALRDNLLSALLASDDPDALEDDLWFDMIETRAGRIEEPPEPEEQRPTLIVWGGHQPWEVRCWEANAAFVRKYGFLLRGCGELLDSSDGWRARRGLGPIPRP